ncbi:hypothetical protein Adt_05906 [Abeliophyllum distichum]|uniref:Uncharacterized protein n=1 Tax=Abeliophyllum distichum TaxID=126358 RepID=A0ABD1V5E4_9LAMI
MIGETAETFLQSTAKELMDSGSQVLDKIRITLEEDHFFYIRGMKKDISEDEYKYDIIFLNKPISSSSTTSITTGSKSDKGKDIAYNTEAPLPLHGQTVPNAVKQIIFPSAPACRSKKRQNKEHPISSDNVNKPDKKDKLGMSKTDGNSQGAKEKNKV